MSRWLVTVAVLAPLVAAGCGGSRTAPRTQLTMVALNAEVGRAVFHLDCSPPGGDLPSSRKACAALRADPALVTRPRGFTCAGGTSSWWDVTVTGRLDGVPIRRSFSTCWTPQMVTIGKLGLGWPVLQQHLVARRSESVLPGTTRRFPPGALRPADLVTCTILGHRLHAGVPDSASTISTGFDGANVVSVSLTVARSRDGSVAASCRRGSS